MSLKDIRIVLAADETFFTDNTLTEENKTKKYKEYQRLVHPDMNLDNEVLAAQAFTKLTQLWESRNKTSETILQAGNQELHVGKLIDTRDFIATFTIQNSNDTLWVTTHPKLNDTFKSGVKKLEKVTKDLAAPDSHYFPIVRNSFSFTDSKGLQRGVLVQIPKGMYSLEEIISNGYPKGVPGRDLGWLYRRMLYLTSKIHEKGITHNGLTAHSFLIHPKEHGVVLKDWQFATTTFEPLTIIPLELKGIHKGVKEKKGSVLSDLFLLGRLGEHLLSSSTPSELTAVIRGLKDGKYSTALEALTDFDRALANCYGERTWHDFLYPLNK